MYFDGSLLLNFPHVQAVSLRVSDGHFVILKNRPTYRENGSRAYFHRRVHLFFVPFEFSRFFLLLFLPPLLKLKNTLLYDEIPVRFLRPRRERAEKLFTACIKII